jgi:hypothetical protein
MFRPKEIKRGGGTWFLWEKRRSRQEKAAASGSFFIYLGDGRFLGEASWSSRQIQTETAPPALLRLKTRRLAFRGGFRCGARPPSGVV